MSSSPSSSSGTAFPCSREEVRQRFLALASGGGPPPDLESFLVGFVEPERSVLRCELEAIRQAMNPGAATADLVPPDAATVDPVAAPPASLAGTMDYVPGTQDGAADHTTDFVASAADGTSPPAGTGGETVDHPSRLPPRPASSRSSGASKRAAKEALGEPPQFVAGYEIVSVLGRGAMGVVYKARQRGLNRLVALKMILAGDHAGAHELARFQAEAEAVAQLHHPNIVQIYEVGEEEGRPYFSLEFVEGPSLDRKVRGTPLPPAEAAQLLQKLAEAMDYAHQHHIIHRDLKPANVLLAEDGTPKIGDFGLAKKLDEDAGQTRTGTVLGTPSYMAPEQAEGRLAEVGPLSDQYSLGAILYELLTGRPPFKGSTILDTLQQVRTLEPVPPIQFQPGVPRDLETICLKCLQKDPAKRYESAGALAEDLRRFLAGEPILARPVSLSERLWRWCKRNPRVAILSAAVLALFIIWIVSSSVLAGVWKYQKNQTDAANVLAEEEAKEATAQKVIAQRNEARAKETARIAVDQMVNLGANLHHRMLSKRLSLANSPDVKLLRQQVLELLKAGLLIVGQQIEQTGTTTFGQEAIGVKLGDLMTRIGFDAEAKQLYEEAYDQSKKHAEADPDNDQARANLGVTTQRLGDAALNTEGDLRKARDRWIEARDMQRDILAHPRGGQRTELQSKTAIAHDDVRVGQALLALGQSREAAKSFEEARKYREDWLAADPNGWEPMNWLSQARQWQGIAAAHLGDEKAAREHFDEAVRLGEDLVKRYDWRPGFKSDMAEIVGAYGDGLLLLGKVEEAEKKYQESLHYLQPLADAKPDDLGYQPQLALAHERLGIVSLALKKSAEARKHYEDAFKLREELLLIDQGDQRRKTNPAAKAGYVLAKARKGDHAAGAAGADRVRTLVGKHTELLLQIVRTYAVCAAANTPQKADLVKRALDTLQEATRQEYRDAFVLENDPELEVLRGEPAFKSILEKVKSR
jgi:serine/threonine protein kinase